MFRKKGRFEKSNGIRIPLVLVAVICVSIVLAVFIIFHRDIPEYTQVESTGTETSESIVLEKTAIDHYEPILDKYRLCLAEGWTKDQCEIEGISPRVQAGSDVTKVGYALLDMDGNGREELIIAEESTSQIDNIWDFYTTLEDGTPIQLWADECDGGQCRLYEDNVISISYSNKHELDITFYYLKSEELVMREMLHWEDEDTVFHTDANGNTRKVTSKEGQSIGYAYDIQKLDLTWLSDAPDYLRDTDTLEYYSPVLEKYKTALREKWDVEQCWDNDICHLVAWLTETPEDLGVYFMYLDSDSLQEMLVVNVHDSTIYDMYTLKNGEPVKLLSGAERNHYTISTENHIINRGSGSAFLSVFNDYVLYQGALTLVESVITDYHTNPDNPWFRSSDGETLGQPLTEQEADAIQNGHERAHFAATPILELN